MKKLMLKLMLPAVVFTALLISANVFSQNVYDVEGYYTVGKTGCTITWDTNDRVFKVYWDGGIGHTLLFYMSEQPNGNYVYEEYESNGSTFTGTFTFNSTHSKGVYDRLDGKKFNITR